MISFTSIAPVGGKVIPNIPKTDDGEYIPRPLGGLVTPPRAPKPRNPRPNQPLGGLVTPRPTGRPDTRPTRPVGGLVTPRHERPELPDFDIFYPENKPEKVNNTKKNVLKAILYTVGLAAAVALGVKYSDKIKNALPEIKAIPNKIKNIFVKK